MMTKIVIGCFLLCSLSLSAQKTIKITSEYGSENQELKDLMDFQNIYVERLNFDSASLSNRLYEIHIQEFKDGQPLTKTTLFDTKILKTFNIAAGASVKFFFSITDSVLKTWIKGNRWSGKRFNFKLLPDTNAYVVQNFSELSAH